MANEPQVLEKGLYIDQDGKLTSEAPENGRQVVAPGLPLDDAARGLLKAEFDLDRDAVDAYIANQVGGTSSSDAGDVDLEKLHKADLEQLAEDNSVDISDASTKADIIEKLNAAGVTAGSQE